MYHIGVIGGGASGMMAAVAAAERGARVTVLEHSDRLGRKILSTGNGKCNFTNLHISEDDYFGDHPSFVTSALAIFGPRDMVQYLEEYGVLSQEKRDGYCYPYSGQAATIRDFFLRRIAELGISVFLRTEIMRIQPQKKGFLVQTKDAALLFDRVILACGGKAAPVTGSDGSVFALLSPLGLDVHRLYPTLAPLYVRDPECKLLSGVRAQGRVVLKVDGQSVCADEGEIQFNKETLSGIPVFQLTHDAAPALCAGKEVTIWVDFLPGMDSVKTRNYLAQIIAARGKLTTGQLLEGLVHQKIAAAILKRLKLSGDAPAEQLQAKQVKKIVSMLHQFVFTVTRQSDFANAQATRGGVCVEELDQHMMVKKVPGMYIVGEMMDVDGKCGGYNLQWAWTSGRIAGIHAAGEAAQTFRENRQRQQ